MIVPIHQGPSPQDLALTALKTCAEDYSRARQARIQVAQAARRAGLTNQQIADAYGITESAVRGLLKRAGDAK